VLIGATALTGFLTGPDELNPYAQFVGKSPVANINGSVLVFRGRFYLPLVAAANHSKAALILADSGDLAQAVTEAQTAAALAANNALIRATLARILVRAQHPAEARAEYETALSLAQTVQPAFQKSLAVAVRQELRSLPPDSVQ
jgi:thioredoxin-like negative regulator of GroEL